MEIIKGKKYKWTPSPIEDLCPQCHSNKGLSPRGINSLVVTVLDTVIGYNGQAPCYCAICGHQYPTSRFEGWYVVDYNGFLGCIPYTQLEEEV